MNINYDAFVKSRLAPESRTPNSIGLTVLLGDAVGGTMKKQPNNQSPDSNEEHKVDIDLRNPIGQLLVDLLKDFRAITESYIERLNLDEDEFYRAVVAISSDIHAYNPERDRIKDLQDSKENFSKETISKISKVFIRLKKSKITFDMNKVFHLLLGTGVVEISLIDLDKLTDDTPLEEINSIYSSIIRNIPLGIAMTSAAIQDIETRKNIEEISTTDIHLKGAKARADKYKSKKEEAFKKFKDGNFHSYAECGRAIYEAIGVKNPNTVANWLSELDKSKK